VVTLARFGLTTGFLLGPADDRRVSPSLVPQKQIFLMGNLCCQYTGCARRRHLVTWFGVLLVMVTRMDVLMCFRADILLDTRMHVSKQVQVSRPSLGRGWL